MAYKREERRILTGGLNLLPPGDLLNGEDSIALQNWRSDQQGNLRSRLGQATLASLGATVNSIFLRNTIAPTRYFGTAAGDLFRGAVLAASGFDGTPIDMVTYLGYVWVMNRAKQGKDNGAFYNWLPAAPTVAPTVAVGAAGVLTGDYQYYYAFDTADGHESDLSPISAVVSPAAQKVALTVIAVSTDGQVSKRRIYRSGGSQDALYQVATLNDNTTTIYTDNLSDDDAARLGITHSADHDPPPAASGLAGPYFGKLLAFNSAAHPNRIWWTPSNKPWYFSNSTQVSEGSWVDVGDDGEAILAISIRPRMCVIYKERSIHRLIGDPDELSSSIEKTHADLGLIGRRAWAQAGAFDYIQAQEGVHVFDGDQGHKVSPKLDPLFKQDFIAPAQGYTPNTPVSGDPAILGLSTMAYRNGRLYYSYADQSHAHPNATMVLDAAEKRWYSDTRGYSALFNEGQYGDLLGGIAGGNVEALENSFDDDGGSIPLVWQSPYLDQGAPEQEKNYADLVIEHDTQGETLTVTAYYDYGQDTQVLGTITSGDRQQTTFTFGVKAPRLARNISIRLEGGSTHRVLIYAMYLHFYIEPREASSFDTGPIELVEGGWGIAEVNQASVEIATRGPVTATLYTDLPEGFLSAAELHLSTVQGLDFKRVEQLPLAEIAEGHIARLTLAGGPFRLYGAGISVREVGFHLPVHGVWKSQKLEAGSKRVKWIKKIAVLFASDNLALDFATDYPNPDKVDSFTLSTVAGRRQWATLRLSGETRARAFDLKFTATAASRVYAIKIWLRVSTEQGRSEWQWLTIPIKTAAEDFAWRDIPV